MQVPPGTVASDAIAQPSHMNFFLVSQEGICGIEILWGSRGAKNTQDFRGIFPEKPWESYV